MASEARRLHERVFEKELSKTDVECRLAFPSKHLHRIRRRGNYNQSSSSMDFQVDDVDGRPYQLRLKIRSGRYKKPEIRRGWLDMVRRKKMKQHDKLIFYTHPGGGDDTHFTIVVRRAVRVFGAVIGHKAAEE